VCTPHAEAEGSGYAEHIGGACGRGHDFAALQRSHKHDRPGEARVCLYVGMCVRARVMCACARVCSCMCVRCSVCVYVWACAYVCVCVCAHVVCMCERAHVLQRLFLCVSICTVIVQIVDLYRRVCPSLAAHVLKVSAVCESCVT